MKLSHSGHFDFVTAGKLQVQLTLMMALFLLSVPEHHAGEHKTKSNLE